MHLLSHIAATRPRVTKAWTDTGYRTKAIEHGARHGIDVEVVQRDPDIKGFKVIPRRWVVERTFGWLMHHRRLARDYETHPHRSGAKMPYKAIVLRAIASPLPIAWVSTDSAYGLEWRLRCMLE